MVVELDMEIQSAGGYIIMFHQLPLPVGPGAQPFAGLSLSRQLAALRFTQERWIRHEHDVHTQILVNQRRLTDDKGLEFSPFLDFLMMFLCTW